MSYLQRGKNLAKRYKLDEFTRFASVGGSSAFVYLLLSNFLDFMHLPLWSSSALSRVAAILVAYFGHVRFTFGLSSGNFGMACRFAVSRAINIGLSVLITYVVKRLFGYPYWVASIAVIVLIFLVSYPIGKFWVFKENSQKSQ